MHDHEQHSGCCGQHCCRHHHKDLSANEVAAHTWLRFRPEMLSASLLAAASLLPDSPFWLKIAAYLAAVLPVGIPILVSTVREWGRGDIFNEFTLMVMASIGAFALGEYPEGVAVLLFYSLGEKLEDLVSGDIKGQIRRLLGKIPRRATVIDNGQRADMKPEDVMPGMIVAVRPGESVPLDGILISSGAIDFNTAAITGESLPRTLVTGSRIESGIIPTDREALVRVTNAYDDSSMTRIIRMIEDSSSHRAPSETILRRITRWYTPLVFAAALLLSAIPWMAGLCNPQFDFVWQTWIRRSLVFLVCACPCALIVSLPLTYFASIGIASRKGVLFKGHDTLDALRSVDMVLLDKTGTVTSGDFHVTDIDCQPGFDISSMLAAVAAIESGSSHPLGAAIVREAGTRRLHLPTASDVRTVSHGITGTVDARHYIIGSARLLADRKIALPDNLGECPTSILVACDGYLAAVISFADTVKPEAGQAVAMLHRDGVSNVGLLSGDTVSAVKSVASVIGADTFMAALLPGEKQDAIARVRKEGHRVAFAGDGVNDAPALAAADVGIAMGNVGTDLAIEAAQMVIAGDDLRKIDEGIHISRTVKHVIIENISFAFGIKMLVMTLGAFGIATLWAAVFADTGVTVITVLWTLYRLKIWQLKKTE